MRQNNIVYSAVVMLFILGLSGCVSVQDSPAVRFYSLKTAGDSAGWKIDVSPDVIIGLNSVRIPEYQNRPQIVTQDKDGMLTFAQFDRWGESLDLAFTRVISENLRVMLSGATIETYPWNAAIPVKYQVLIDVIRLENRLDEDLSFAAQWSVIDAQNRKVLFMKRSEFRQQISPHTYRGLAEALGIACASLSKEIAEAIPLLSK